MPIHPPHLRAFFDQPTNTISYLVADPVTQRAVIIDPVLDFDRAIGPVDVVRWSHSRCVRRVRSLTFEWLLETHAHADHLCGAPYLKWNTGARIGIGADIKDVQRIFRPVFNADGLRHGRQRFRPPVRRRRDVSSIGELEVEVLQVPGHTPADMALRDGRCGVRGRHAVHARRRHGALRFSGWRCAPAVSFDPAAACSAEGHAPVHVPRLQGAGSRRLRLGYHGGRATREQHPSWNGRCHRGGVRDEAAGPRCDVVRADAAVALNPGEHSRGAFSEGRGNGVHDLLLAFDPRPEGGARLCPMAGHRVGFSPATPRCSASAGR